MADFSPKEIVSKAWLTTKSNLGFLVGLTLVVILISALPSVGQSLIQAAMGKTNTLGIIITLGIVLFSSLWLQPVIQAGNLQIYLHIVDGKSRSLGQLFSRKELWGKWFLASLLYGLISLSVFLGLFLVYGVIFGVLSLTGLSNEEIMNPTGYRMGVLIIPSIVAILALVVIAIRYSFYNYFLVDRNAGIGESLKSSWQATQGLTGKLLLFSLLIAGINVLGLLALGVGLLVTAPLSVLAETYLYRQIVK